VRDSEIELEKERMKTRIVAITLSVLFLIACNGAWAQTSAASGAPVWHGDGSIGLSLARGNANTFLLSGSATAENIWEQNHLKLGADGQYGLNNWGQTNQTQSTEAIHGFIDYKRLFTERFYGSARIDGYHDDIAEVRYRIIVGPAAGYYFIKSDASKLNGEIGPSFVDQKLGSNTESYVTIRFSERGEHTLNKAKTAKVWEEVDFMPQVDDFNNYLLNSEVGAEAAFNTRFSLRVVADDHFDSRPASGKKENDILLISSLVYKY
jgi:putative salt-induced outer membrane protein YdiY